MQTKTEQVQEILQGVLPPDIAKYLVIPYLTVKCSDCEILINIDDEDEYIEWEDINWHGGPWRCVSCHEDDIGRNSDTEEECWGMGFIPIVYPHSRTTTNIPPTNRYT